MNRRLLSLPAVAFGLLLLSGCVGMGFSKKGEMLARETFDADGTFSRTFDKPPGQVCEAARRALLSQGYVVSRADPVTVEANKNFQPESDVHEQLQLRVFCVVQESGQAWISATANQERYNLAKRNTSASLGVGGLGSLSLPIGSTDDSLVRVGSMTVQDPDFYRSFFKLVERYLPAVTKIETEVEAKAAAKAKAEADALAAVEAKAEREAASAASLWQPFVPVQWPSSLPANEPAAGASGATKP